MIQVCGPCPSYWRPASLVHWSAPHRPESERWTPEHKSGHMEVFLRIISTDLDLLAFPEPDDVLLEHQVLAAVVSEDDHQGLGWGVLQSHQQALDWPMNTQQEKSQTKYSILNKKECILTIGALLTISPAVVLSRIFLLHRPSPEPLSYCIHNGVFLKRYSRGIDFRMLLCKWVLNTYLHPTLSFSL